MYPRTQTFCCRAKIPIYQPKMQPNYIVKTILTTCILANGKMFSRQRGTKKSPGFKCAPRKTSRLSLKKKVDHPLLALLSRGSKLYVRMTQRSLIQNNLQLSLRTNFHLCKNTSSKNPIQIRISAHQSKPAPLLSSKINRNFRLLMSKCSTSLKKNKSIQSKRKNKISL